MSWQPVASKNMKYRTVRQQMTRAGSLSRYGPSLAAVYAAGQTAEGAKAQMLNREADGYYGKGRYSRRLRSYGRRRYGTRMRHRRYGGRGLYSGTGGYWDDIKSGWNKWSGRLGAGFKAGASAMGYGGVADALTQAEGLGRSMGMGAYDTPITNAIVDGGGSTAIPTFTGTSDTSVTISHREYINDLFGPPSAGTFQNTVYSINPGLERTFPWLSQVAANYEEYTLKQCIFTYRTTVTDFVSTGGQVGTVIMASQYNPSDTPFQSKQDAMEYDMAMSGKVSSDMLHGVECDPAQLSGTSNGKYIRSGPPRSDDDLKQYDWANLNVCVSNIPSAFVNQALGELWVSYTVELRKPKFFVSRGLNILRDTFVGTAAGPVYLQDMISNYDYGEGQQNRIGGTILTASTGLPSQGPLAANAIRYVFPATFSGSVIFKATADSSIPTAPGEIECSFVRSNAGVSNIAINDQWHQGAWTNNIVAGNSALTGPCMTENHYTMVTPTSAGTTLDNYVDVRCITSLTGLDVKIENFTLDVSMYNTQFNYPSSGNIIVVNPVTMVQEPWP